KKNAEYFPGLEISKITSLFFVVLNMLLTENVKKSEQIEEMVSPLFFEKAILIDEQKRVVKKEKYDEKLVSYYIRYGIQATGTELTT
ncbi:MAG: hypothetical protein MHPSP_002177, partial [Paramarteilia canceri]